MPGLRDGVAEPPGGAILDLHPPVRHPPQAGLRRGLSPGPGDAVLAPALGAPGWWAPFRPPVRPLLSGLGPRPRG